MRSHSLGDWVFDWTDRLLGWGSANLPYQSALVRIVRGSWSIIPAIAAANLPSFFAAAWEPLRYAWPVVILIVGIGQFVAIMRNSLYWRRLFCMAAIVVWTFSTLLFALLDSVIPGLPLLPVYLSFVVAGIFRYLRLEDLSQAKDASD